MFNSRIYIKCKVITTIKDEFQHLALPMAGTLAKLMLICVKPSDRL